MLKSIDLQLGFRTDPQKQHIQEKIINVNSGNKRKKNE